MIFLYSIYDYDIVLCEKKLLVDHMSSLLDCKQEQRLAPLIFVFSHSRFSVFV